ncbi:MAG TPA: histidine triad nucleotide-binding protein, partial [Verrucomicrobiae bacterium]|jgi:histidine triad (HIT) family protein|nr:histidine triad nucleotide-binding protein [Verrucomicrobiae bacterium]
MNDQSEAVSSRAADPACLFCRIVAGEIPAARVHEDDVVIAIRDIAPRAPTHVLFLPREHIASAAELTPADGPMLGRLFGAAAAFARAEGLTDAGYRMVTNVGEWGGQTVGHLHVHLLGGRSMTWPPG